MPVLLPEKINQALKLLQDDPNCHIMAGGTDVLVRMRAAGSVPDSIVCLDRIAELKDISVQGNRVRIGGGVTIAALLNCSIIKEKLPLLHRAAMVFASPPIRNMATIGGNICTASPAGDVLPPLYIMNASVELLSSQGTRTMPLDTFISGPRQTDLRDNELLAAINVDIPVGFDIHSFEKVGQRAALAISVVSMAGLVAVENGTIQQARFAWGSVGPTVIRCPQAETFLQGKALTRHHLDPAAEMVRGTTSPISDTRASAAYRRQVAGNLLLRLAML